MILIDFIRDILTKARYWISVNRIGPDIPLTHWCLHYPSLMQKLCQRRFSSFGSSSVFRPGAYAVETQSISIGERVVIRPGVMLFGVNIDEGCSIIIEDNVLIGSGVHVYVSNHNFDLFHPVIDQGHSKPKGVKIRRGCWIGSNVIILPGVEIGENSVVGSGSVVTRSIPPGVVAVGVPARVIKTSVQLM